MIEKDTDRLQDTDSRELFRHVMREGQGVLIELDAAPDSDAPLLEANQAGVYNNDLYWRMGQTIYKFTSDDQITVS